MYPNRRLDRFCDDFSSVTTKIVTIPKMYYNTYLIMPLYITYVYKIAFPWFYLKRISFPGTPYIVRFYSYLYCQIVL